MKTYILYLRDRPFYAIKAGTKTIEGRVPTSWDTTPFKEMKKGEQITFIRESDNEKLITIVRFIHHYPDVKTMLQIESVSNILSSGGTIATGIKSYHAIEEYKENIPIYGIYAIGIEYRAYSSFTYFSSD